MDIPTNNDNTYANAIEAATKYALEKISSSKYGNVILCWRSVLFRKVITPGTFNTWLSVTLWKVTLILIIQ